MTVWVACKSSKTARTWLWRHSQSANSRIHILKPTMRIWIFEHVDREWRHSPIRAVLAFIYLLLVWVQTNRFLYASATYQNNGLFFINQTTHFLGCCTHIQKPVSLHATELIWKKIQELDIWRIVNYDQISIIDASILFNINMFW